MEFKMLPHSKENNRQCQEIPYRMGKKKQNKQTKNNSVYKSDRELISRIYKKSTKIKHQKANYLINKWAKELNRQVLKGEHGPKVCIILSHWRTWTDAVLRLHPPPSEWPSSENKWQQMPVRTWGNGNHINFCFEYKLVQPLQKSHAGFPEN